jgi:hypothetical protein
MYSSSAQIGGDLKPDWFFSRSASYTLLTHHYLPTSLWEFVENKAYQTFSHDNTKPASSFAVLSCSPTASMTHLQPTIAHTLSSAIEYSVGLRPQASSSRESISNDTRIRRCNCSIRFEETHQLFDFTISDTLDLSTGSLIIRHWMPIRHCDDDWSGGRYRSH